MDNNFDFVTKNDGTKVYKDKAMIGLISDFGKEGKTRDMSFDELEVTILISYH